MRNLKAFILTCVVMFPLVLHATLVSSGETAIATTSDTAVAVLTDTAGGDYYSEMFIINEGTVAGFFSIDGGTTWGRLPAGPSSIRLSINTNNVSLKVKRVAGGSNLTGVYAWAN